VSVEPAASIITSRHGDVHRSFLHRRENLKAHARYFVILIFDVLDFDQCSSLLFM
jgi:hypothetical protein